MIVMKKKRFIHRRRRRHRSDLNLHIDDKSQTWVSCADIVVPSRAYPVAKGGAISV